jgi:hypothetical protein
MAMTPETRVHVLYAEGIAAITLLLAIASIAVQIGRYWNV